MRKNYARGTKDPQWDFITAGRFIKLANNSNWEGEAWVPGPFGVQKVQSINPGLILNGANPYQRQSVLAHYPRTFDWPVVRITQASPASISGL
jgi:hypothetical protein